MPNRRYGRQQDSRLRLLLTGIVLEVACIEPRGQASGEAETDMAWQKDLPLVGPDARLEADVSPDSPPPATGPCDDGSPRCCDGGAAPPCNGCPAGTVVPEGFVCVPSGTFTMGSNEDEPGHKYGEIQHEVTLTHAFFIGLMEVTLEGYRPFDHMGSAVLDCGLTCPASFLSFFHAAMYSNARSAAEGLPGCSIASKTITRGTPSTRAGSRVQTVWGIGCPRTLSGSTRLEPAQRPRPMAGRSGSCGRRDRPGALTIRSWIPSPRTAETSSGTYDSRAMRWVRNGQMPGASSTSSATWPSGPGGGTLGVARSRQTPWSIPERGASMLRARWNLRPGSAPRAAPRSIRGPPRSG